MDPEPQAPLDQEVATVLAALQEAGEPITAEGVRRRVGRRMTDVLAAMKRLTRGTTAPDVDANTPPEHDPRVHTAAAKVAQLTEAVAVAEVDVTAAEQAYAEVEAQAAAALIDGREPISLMEALQAVLHAAETLHLLQLAATTAKDRYTDALTEAQAAQRRAIWRHFQALLATHLVAARQMVESWEPLRAYCAQHEWAFGLLPFNGTMQVMGEAWVPHVEDLLAQAEIGHSGVLPLLPQLRAY